MSQKKFIITKDEKTANQFIAFGFQLVSKTADLWIFMNSVPKHFNFDEVDKGKFCYSNILCL